MASGIGEVRAPSPPSAPAPAAKRARLESNNNNRTQYPASNAYGKARSLSKTQKRRAQYNSLPEPCSADDVLWREIIGVLGQDYVDTALAEGTDRQSPFEYHQELEMQVVAICSTGSALATTPASPRPWVVVVPFALPGETIRVKVYRNARLHSVADLLAIVTPNPELRDDSAVRCKYFGTCGGCQYQMLSYENQLNLKRDVIVKAYRNFSDLPETAIPTIEATMPSPKQYAYRTKITPHFEAPTKAQRVDPNNPQGQGEKPEWCKIGFNSVGTHKVMDIEDCPIATPIIQETLPKVRANVVKNLYTYKKGVSLILRDSLAPGPSTATSTNADSMHTDASEPEITKASASPQDDPEPHVCITDHRGTVRERVGPWIFEYPNSSFFQNNNSVLPSLVEYVRGRIFAPFADAATSNLESNATDGAGAETPAPTHLVDAYCGAGLFAITLSPHFRTVTGIELSAESIRAATRNAELNAHLISPTPTNDSDPTAAIASKTSPNPKAPPKISFLAGDATNIFRTVSSFPPAQTVLLIDPPRKGCDQPFLDQLLRFGAGTVVYVSCNVHTQARDVGVILRGQTGSGGKGRYVLESVRGFDLFPQTAHVESVAVLRLVQS
ncbi:S-adenosyl-L-methionine-dependent methyltransferase [Mycena galopus ATCC 62051]|nr:S-adenosyl-L-methionine-dependent methyltransferase [Mycena galopus ATCC 62051]